MLSGRLSKGPSVCFSPQEANFVTYSGFWEKWLGVSVEIIFCPAEFSCGPAKESYNLASDFYVYISGQTFIG